MKTRALLFISLALCASYPASAAGSDNDVCDDAAQKAEQKFQLPDGLLQAVARVETNSSSAESMKAWPWTVNLAGEGKRFATRSAAEKFVAERRTGAAVSIDIGCFQINTKWHGDAFESAGAMFDPQGSADYAASFLNALKKEKGDWKSAVETYHSRTPKKAKRYADKVMQAYAETKGPSEFNIFTTPGASPLAGFDSSGSDASAGGVQLSLFREIAPLLSTDARGPIIDRTAVPSVFSRRGDGAN